MKVLFFINCIDSNLPKKESAAGIFTDDQREKLTQMQLELAPSARENSINERFYLHELFNQPEDMIFITYSRRDRKGKGVMPSTYLPMITSLFEKPFTASFDAESAGLPENRKEARRMLAASLRDFRTAEDPAMVRQLYASFAADPSEAGFLKLVTEAGFFVRPPKFLSKESLERLYPGNVDTNITRLEKQAGCAYSAFLRYGLGLKELDLFEMNASDVGSIDHELIEAVIRELVQRGTDPAEADEALCGQLLKEALASVHEKYADHMSDSDRSSYYIERFRKVTEKNIRFTLDQLAGSSFRPVATERKFDGRSQEELTIPVNGDKSLILSGRIDRIDASRGDNGQIVRVIDYKTGNTMLDLNKVVNGLSLQLMVYMMALKGMFREDTTAGGAYYYKIDSPTIDVKPGEIDAEKTKKEIMEKMRLEGLQLDTPAVKAADPGTKPTKVTPQQLDKLYQIVRDSIFRLGEDLLQGRIDPMPARQWGSGGFNTCDWCDYAGVCGFDDRLAGSRYKKIRKKTSKEVLEEITESGSDGSDN